MVDARIALAANTGALDLSNCGLEEVPAAVWQLSELVDLSLAGNRIKSLPPAVGQLRKLRRLGVAGNLLESVPEEIGGLPALEGLWLHGNALHTLPNGIGSLSNLKVLALAGNRLCALPDSICRLSSLTILSAAGNLLSALPEAMGSLALLQTLALNGNRLTHLPASVGVLPSLRDLWLQGNRLRALPHHLDGLRSLRHLSVADNVVAELPPSVGALQALETLWLYGNELRALPVEVGACRGLRQLWVESNPLEGAALQALLPLLCHLRSVGIDSGQAGGLAPSLPLSDSVSLGRIAGSGRAGRSGGYFTLHSAAAPADTLVVAFGSAPGVPNWGGVLKKVRHCSQAPFDILYVVDPARSWYTHPPLQGGVGGPEYYREEVGAAAEGYARVVLLGDSMGASAALRFAPLATAVMAFCPQTDLTSASIRPGESGEWQAEFGRQLLQSVRSSSARMEVHCGNWEHDVEQARRVEGPNCRLAIHPLEEHRLAKELDAQQLLVPLVQRGIEGKE